MLLAQQPGKTSTPVSPWQSREPHKDQNAPSRWEGVVSRQPPRNTYHHPCWIVHPFILSVSSSQTPLLCRAAAVPGAACSHHPERVLSSNKPAAGAAYPGHPWIPSCSKHPEPVFQQHSDHIFFEWPHQTGLEVQRAVTQCVSQRRLLLTLSSI